MLNYLIQFKIWLFKMGKIPIKSIKSEAKTLFYNMEI